MGKNDLLSPVIKVQDHNGQQDTYIITKNRVIIGRHSETNDIVLEPDPQKLVTRHMHCMIESRDNGFWLTDNASKNGTFLKRGGQIKRIFGEEKIANKDTILILAMIDTNGNPTYWELQFIDPQATEDVQMFMNKQYLEYDWIQAKLFLVNNTSRSEISGLTPQEHKLIRYMEQRNRQNGYTPVMCTYEELLMAIWDDQHRTHTKNDVLRLIWGLRKKIETDPQNPVFLMNIKGMGYRLIINPVV